MAASSPVPNNNNKIGGEPVNIIASSATINGGSTTPQRLITAIDAPTPKQSQRGQNKPKCIKCGNVARSRFVHPFGCLVNLM